MGAVKHPSFTRFIPKLDQAIRLAGSDGYKALEYVTPVLDELLRNDQWMEKRFTRTLPHKYAFYLLYKPPDASYSIVSGVWAPGQKTAPHDHSSWAVIGMVQGREGQTRYKRIDDGLRAGSAKLEDIGSYETRENDIDYVIRPRDIHRVQNMGTEPSVSIHIYGCDIGNVVRRKYDAERSLVEEWVSGYDTPPA